MPLKATFEFFVEFLRSYLKISKNRLDAVNDSGEQKIEP
jgi:hypothetical protein